MWVQTVFFVGFWRNGGSYKTGKKIRINAYKDYLLDRTEDDIPIEEYLQPVGESDYLDYFLFQRLWMRRDTRRGQATN